MTNSSNQYLTKIYQWESFDRFCEITFQAAIVLLCLGVRELSLALVSIIFLLNFKKSVKVFFPFKDKIQLWFVLFFYLSLQFSLPAFHLVSETSNHFYAAKLAIVVTVFLTVSLVLKEFLIKNFLWLLLVPPFIYTMLSLILTLIIEPKLINQRNIFDFPIFGLEWGPTLCYYNLSLIALNIFFIHHKRYFFLICSVIMLFLSIAYGVRGVFLTYALSLVIYLFSKKPGKKEFLSLLISIGIFAGCFFLEPLTKPRVGSKEYLEALQYRPSVFRGMDSPRRVLVKDFFTENFLLKNIFGGKKTEFSHPDFRVHTHNYPIEIYWYYGLIPFSIFLLILLNATIKSNTLEKRLILIGFMATMLLNIFQNWYLILFFIFYGFLIETRRDPGVSISAKS